MEKWRDGHDGRVVALDVTHLQNAVALLRELDQPSSVIDFVGHRFLDQHVAAGLDQFARDGEMAGGRCRNDGALDLASERVNRIETAKVEGIGNIRRRGVVEVDEADHLRVRDLGQHASMQAAEVAGADDADAGLHRMIPRFEPRANSTRYRASGYRPSSVSIFCS